MVWNYIANGELKFGTQNQEQVRIDLNGKVGIGTALPQRLLHVAGTGNTIRVEGLSGTGTFSTAPTASTDRLMYADANGDIKAIPEGSSGQILALNGSGIPQWTTSSTTNDWSITGNSGTVDGTNFIGTTDNVPFNIRVDNQKAGRIDHINNNTSFGYQSANSLITGIWNTAFGFQAMLSTNTGNYNTAVGNYSMRFNTAGGSNTSVGESSLYNNTGGSNNVAVGAESMFQNTSGTANIAVGFAALRRNTTAIGNVGLGAGALINNLTGNYNTGVGYDVLASNTTGGNNTANGTNALSYNTVGNNNSALGCFSNVSSGNLNNATAIGANAYVAQSNSLVLGSINGFNGATASVNVGIGTSTPAYTLDVYGDISRTGSFTNTATNADMYGIYGSCNNTPFYGYGAYFQGGYVGTYTQATLAGSGSRYGLSAYANSGTTAYGVYANASNATTNYGVYGTAGGGTTNWAGYFNGAVFGTSYTTSDRKLKRDIQPLTNATSLLAQLKPATYQYRVMEFPQMNLEEGLQYGLLADEVKQVIPGAVKKAVAPAVYENNDEKNGKLLHPEVEFDALNYAGLIPIMIATIQEQQQQIERLTKLIEGGR